MYILVVLLPLLSSLLLSIYGYRLGYRGASGVGVLIMGFTVIFSVLIFYEVVMLGNKCFIEGPSWLLFGIFNVNWGFLFDTVTGIMLVVVSFVSFFVHMYSVKYMEEDPHFVRFLSYLGLFTFFMMFLITGDNLASIFLGWEGVGLASYLLINFWYTRNQANKAAIKAVIVNKIGDIGILLCLAALFLIFKSIKLGVIFSLVYILNSYDLIFCGMNINILIFISLCFFIGAASKSAQCGLHTWLPDAMEGPTPVSALIHAATMVTAGVFVIIRFAPMLEYSFEILIIISIMGCLTAFFAGTIGLFQYDLKRVIAYSTCSQLGYMIMACGMSAYGASMFHLMTHAFFKALLFLGAGAVIHGMSDEQDMRKMGGLLKLMPFTYVVMSIGSLALIGFPFTSGYYSKDFILEVVKSELFFDGLFCYFLGVVGAVFTAYYSVRSLYMTFVTESKSYKKIVSNVHEAPILMLIPLFFLSLASIFVGYASKDIFLGMGVNSWDNALLSSYIEGNKKFIEIEYMLAVTKFFPVLLSLFGALLGIIVYKNYEFYVLRCLLKEIKYIDLYKFFLKKWVFDVVYNRFIVQYTFVKANLLFYKQIDRGILEILGPSGMVRIGESLIQKVIFMQSGSISNYIYFMTLGILLNIFLLDILHLGFILSFDSLSLLYLISV
jgi:proton-translocating NADH-quinone oxidoreductase chain L